MFTSQMTIPDDHRWKSSNASDKNRRRSIIPTSHLPKEHGSLPPVEEEPQNLSNDDLLLFDDYKPTAKNNPVITSNKSTQSDDVNITSQANKSNLIQDQGQEDEDSDFDSLILENFTQYSGTQDVNVWLNETVKKFNRLFLSNYSRRKAIPLLVEGTANKVYVQNKRHIHSFADFQELLLLYFDNDDPVPNSFHRPSSLIRQNSELTRNNLTNEKSTPSMSTFDNSNFSERPPRLHSTALHENKTGTGVNEPFSSSNTTNPTPMITMNNVSDIDGTTNVLRKALIHQLMNNPNTFRGGNDDVVKWLEDLEHSYEVAQIPDSNKLNLVAYALRGDALVWYKNHKSTFSTWDNFLSQLKHTYVPVYFQELAFKKLDAYSQTENQSVCNFYNHLIKLCNDTDPTMTDSTKLKHLLNKTKPSLQFEIRRKKPTTTQEYLEYGKDIEELFRLSTFNTNINLSNNNHNTAFTPTAIISPSVTPSTTNNPTELVPPNNRSSNTNNFRATNSPQQHNNTHRSTLYIPPPTNSYPSRPTNSSYNGPRTSQVPSNNSSNLPRQKTPSNLNHSQDARANNFQRPRTFLRTNPSQQHHINSLMHSNYTDPSAPEEQPIPPNYVPQHQSNLPPFQNNQNF